MLVCLALSSGMLHSASAAELQWRKAAPRHFKPSAAAQPIAKANNFAKPQPRRDGAVRAVAFESNEPVELQGPKFAAEPDDAQPADEAHLTSRVVDSGRAAAAEEFNTVRAAQLQTTEPDTDNRYGEQIVEPFGQPPEVTESTETNEVELNEEQITLPPEEMTETQPAPPATIERQPTLNQRQPRSFQPAPAPSAPRPDPFVEDDDETNVGLPNTEDPTLSDEGVDSQADCAKELAALKAHTLDQVDLSIVVAGNPGKDFPVECSIDDGAWHAGRCWDETTYMWKASAICHKPLYFEDEALERYGHSWGPCLDPIVSGAHFFATLPVLPYCMGVHPPTECMYALGHYRPGSCAPYTIGPVPLSCRGAVLEAGAVVGAAAILP